MDIKQLIRECLHEEIERQTVKEIIREELNRMYNEGLFEGVDEGVFEGDDKKDDKKNNEKEKDSGKKRSALGQLNTILDKNPIIKKSQIAYRLHPGVDHDSARHMFQDQLEGEDPITTKELNTAIDFIHNSGI